jgi:hypothetical protein
MGIASHNMRSKKLPVTTSLSIANGGYHDDGKANGAQIICCDITSSLRGKINISLTAIYPPSTPRIRL